MAMNTGMDKYRSMMKRMEQMDPSSVTRASEMMRPDNIEETTSDLMNDPNLKGMMNPPMPVSKLMEMMKQQEDSRSVVRDEEIPMSIEIDGQTMMMKPSEIQQMIMQEQLDPRSVVRAGEMGKNLSMLEKQMADLTMSDKEAIEALTSMGISLEDAMQAVLDPQSVVREGEIMGPALGALPMPRPTTRSVTREGEMDADRMGADRTQDMNMQKFNMGT